MKLKNGTFKRLCCIFICGCLFASLLPSASLADVLSELSERGGAFRVLEVVDDTRSASVGWYIGGAEPVDFALGLRSSKSSSERSEYMSALGTALDSRGLSGGEDRPLSFEAYREALPWEAHEGLSKLTLDHTEFASVRGTVAALSGGGWSRYTEDGAEYVYMGEGAGEFAFLPSQYGGEVSLAYYTVYTEGGCVNREFFKRAAFALTPAQCAGVRVELRTLEAQSVTEDDIDSADLVLICGTGTSQSILNYIVASGKASASYPEGFSTAPVNDELYSLCADVTPVALMAETGRSITVLDIEPRTNISSLTESAVKGWFAADTVSVVTIECMSVAELIGSRRDLIGEYDLVYIGASGTNIPGGDKPNYNDDALDGYYYSATGDKLVSTRDERYTPFDLTAEKRAELLAYANAGYPVVVADELMQTGASSTFSVSIEVTSKLLGAPKIFTASVNIHDATVTVPENEIHYQWYRTSGSLENNSTSSTYTRGSNSGIDIGTFQCAVTIYGSTAYSNSIEYVELSGRGGFPESSATFRLESGVRSDAVDPLSNMFALLDGIKDLSNVSTASTASAITPVGAGLRVTSPRADVPRLDLTSSGKQEVGTDANGDPVTVDTYALTIDFTLENASGYTAKLYIDRNLDDKFLSEEQVTNLTLNPDTLTAGVNSLTYTFPSGTSGLLPWKLVVTDGTRYDSKTGYAYIEPESSREIRVLYRDAVPSGNLTGGDDFTFKAVATLAECDVLVLSKGYTVTAEEQQFISGGGAVVYLKDAAPTGGAEPSVYAQMPGVTGGVSYVSLKSVNGNVNSRYSTDSASIANVGAVLRYPNVVKDTQDIAHDNGKGLATAPAARLPVPMNANVYLCLTESGKQTGNKAGEAFSYVPNDVRNDYFLYTSGKACYLGLDIGSHKQVSEDGLKLLSNAIAWAYLSRGGESSVKFVYKGTQDVMRTMYFPSDENGLLLPDGRGTMCFYITLPDVGEGVETTTLTFSYTINGVEVADIPQPGARFTSGTGYYPIPKTVLDALASKDTKTATVTVTLADSSSATMNLQRFNLLSLK